MTSRPNLAAVTALAVSLAVATASVVGAQTAGREPVNGQPTPGGSTYIDLEHPVTASGELRVWQVASSEGARVMLKVFRPDGDRFLLVGTSPLEVVPAGGVATFECRIPVARNDVIGCFCPDSSCADAFGDGQMLSADGDRGTSAVSDFTSGTGSPAIFGTGWRLADVPSGAGTDLVVPAVGRTPGVAGTFWSTRLELFNPSDGSTAVALYLNLSDLNNTTPAASGQVLVGPRETLVIDDLFGEIFGLTEGLGSVDVVASEPIIAHARIANLGASEGSFGQAVPAVPARWSVGDDAVPGVHVDSHTSYLFEVLENNEYRSNLGLASTVSSQLEVEVLARVGDSVVGSPLSLELEAFSHTQVNRVLQQIGVPEGQRGVRLEVRAAPGTGGRFLAYLSRVDNQSGDAVFLLGDRQASTH